MKWLKEAVLEYEAAAFEFRAERPIRAHRRPSCSVCRAVPASGNPALRRRRRGPTLHRRPLPLQDPHRLRRRRAHHRRLRALQAAPRLLARPAALGLGGGGTFGSTVAPPSWRASSIPISSMRRFPFADTTRSPSSQATSLFQPLVLQPRATPGPEIAKPPDRSPSSRSSPTATRTTDSTPSSPQWIPRMVHASPRRSSTDMSAAPPSRPRWGRSLRTHHRSS